MSIVNSTECDICQIGYKKSLDNLQCFIENCDIMLLISTDKC